MPRTITQRELRNDSGDIMRDVDAGETFLVTRNGVPAAELRPVERRRFVTTETARATATRLAGIDAKRFFTDLDGLLDQAPTRG